MPYSNTCPNQGHCACPAHADGLAAYAPDPDAYHRSLHALQPTRLRVVTPGPPVEQPACTGGYCCSCQDCLKARVQPRPRAHAAQPWQARPSRYARAA